MVQDIITDNQSHDIISSDKSYHTLFRRKFGTYQKAATRSDSEEGEGERGEVPQPLSPEKDRTPFVQGFYFQVGNLVIG